MRNLNMPQNSFVQLLFYGLHLLKFDFCQILSHFNTQILRCRRLFTFPMKVNKTSALILLLEYVPWIRLHTLLHVVACFWDLVQKVSKQLLTFLLFSDHRGVAQQCWIHLHSFSNIAGAMHEYYTWSPLSLQRLMGCILPIMHCRSNIVGSCCIRLHTTANTHATTPNIVGLLGVVEVH